MRIFLFLFIALLAWGHQAKADYTVPRDIETLLADALQPATEETRFAKFTALKYLRYHLPKDAEIIRPHLSELEALYSSQPAVSDTRSSLAITLLTLNSELDSAQLRLDALPESNDRLNGPDFTTAGILRALGQQIESERASEVLTGIMQNDRPIHWGGNYEALDSFITSVTQLLKQDISANRPQHLADLVRYRMTYAGYFRHYKEQEQQAAGYITIYDHHSDAEVDTLLPRLDAAICSYPPQAGQKRWIYTFVPHTAMFETGATTDLVCGE